jgi:hypothetical protein
VLLENLQHPRFVGLAVKRLRDQALQLGDVGQDDGRLGGIIAVHRTDAAEKIFYVVTCDAHDALFLSRRPADRNPKPPFFVLRCARRSA